MKKFTLFLVATLFSALSFAALNPYAYGLSSKLSDDEKTVTITYKLNASSTTVSVVVLDGETVLKTQPSTGTTQGEHSVDISTDGFPKGKTLSWKVEVTGAGVTDVECTNDATESKYMFFRPQGVAIDNNPESDFFGRIYIALPRGGYDHTKGIVVFDPIHDVLSNSGITATGVALGTNDTYAMHRIAVNPNGKVYYAKSESPTAIYELTPDNTNILSDGGAAKNVISSMSVITNANSLCFDKSGAMYVLGNAGYASATDTYTGKIYKIENGNISEFTKEYYRWASKDNSIVPDDRGGFWVAQQRTNFDGCDVLAHVNSNGVRDYQINKTTNNALLPTKTDGTSVNASYRGQVAHYLIDDNNGILAFGGGGKVSIFKVTYAASEVPTLTAWKTISLKNTSWKANVDGLAFDYAGNLIVMSATDETFEHYALPKDNNTCITPCPSKHAFSLTADPQLNPFAYNLWSELSADEKNLTINYSLNAKATSVEWVLMDGNNEVKTVDLASLGLEKGDYTTTISTTDFPQYKALTWKIEVKGVAVSEPTEYPISHDFYHPSSVDIDNNPENPTFGLILCNEAMQSVKGKKQTDTGEDYLSSSLGAGIFAFNPAFENTGKYNGGITFTNGRADNASATAYAPRRIRISDDGRIFVTSLNTDGNYLWEVDPENMNEWTPVFKGTLNSNKELVDASSNFVAAPNNGFDVKGSGENLKLAMYSVNLPGITSADMSGYRLHEYNLGTATEWATAPSKALVEGKYACNYTGTQVEYDNEGGFWIASHRGSASNTNPGLVHINQDGKEDRKYVWSYVQQAGIRFNKDFTKLVVAGVNGGSTAGAKKATVYTITKDGSGAPELTEEVVIDMATLGYNLNDFAWDYAGNLYGVSNSSEKIAVWAMPHSSDDVVATPAASKYAFSIGKYTVTVNTNDVNKGIVSGAGEYLPGATATLTATPKEGYELLYWSDRSTENPRTITMNKNEALSAYFIKKNDVEPTFSITKVWENTNVPASTSNGYQAVGWDGKIYMQDAGNKKIVTYSSKEDLGTDYVTGGGAGQQIAVDEAGNLIVFNAWFATGTPNAILIYKKGSTEGKAVTFTLLEPGRCDFFSASGNIFSAEGGYVYFYCQNKTVVNRVKITNGAATDADITIDAVGSEIAKGNSQNHVIVDIFGNLMAHSRTNSNTYAINVLTDESKLFVLPNHKYSTLGGCSFELSGKELWAYNIGTTAYTSEWNLYNVTDKENLSNEVLYVKDKTAVGSAANWLNVQVVDEKTAYIYQFCPAVGAAVWKVTRDHIVSATAENGSVTGTGTYKDNETATLTATPNDGYRFKNWTKNGEVVSTENPYSFTVTEDVELVANFDGPFCELILNTNDEAKGTVSGAGFYIVGQTVTIEAIPQAGYKLLYWSDRSTDNPRTITMTKNEAISAYFVKEYDEEPTFKIEKMWENTQVPGSADGYQAVGWGGNIYMQNKTAGKIKIYTNDTDAAVDYATSNTSGQQIAVDEAGNLIVFNATFSSATPNAIQIYQKGSTTAKAINFTLPNPGRCDFFSASGDIYSAEGGYVYFYCQNKNAVNRVKITNGELASVDAIGNTANPATSVSHVMVDIFGNLAAHCRSTAVYAINSYTGETTAFTTTLSGVKLSTLGGCTFELGGKELWAYNVGTTNYNSEWNLYNMTDKVFMSNETLYAKDKDSRKNTGPANWLNVQVVDENTAYIYQFCPEVAVAMWKVSINRTDLQEFTVTASANDPTMGTVTGGGTYYEGATAILTATANSGYRFVNWTKDETILSTDASFTYTVPAENVTIVANFEALPTITYELNGGVWNQYGWTSKKDMYDAFIADWKAYSGSTRGTKTYEDQYGIGKSNGGLPTTIQNGEPILEFMALPKWSWLAEFLDAIATEQGITTKTPSSADVHMRYALGNFFGEDNNKVGDSYVDAVDCSGDNASLSEFAPYWGQTFPMPTQPTEEVVLNAPYREGYEFDGWYTTSDFSGAAVTTVDGNTDGTLYAKWIETIITVTIDENADNTAALAPYVGKTVTATVTRSFDNDSYKTITLPFSMDAAQISAVFGDATVLEFINVIEGPEINLRFRPTSKIVAGTPYIIALPEGEYDAKEDGFTIEDVVIDTELRPITFGNITMQPVLDAGEQLTKTTEYWLATDNYLYNVNDPAVDMPGLRAYFISSSPLPIRARVVYEENEETELPIIQQQPENNVRKIMKDGQIIIIRGEQQYNVQGQRID